MWVSEWKVVLQEPGSPGNAEEVVSQVFWPDIEFQDLSDRQVAPQLFIADGCPAVLRARLRNLCTCRQDTAWLGIHQAPHAQGRVHQDAATAGPQHAQNARGGAAGRLIRGTSGDKSQGLHWMFVGES